MLGSGDFFSIAYIVVFNVMPKPAALYFWCVIAFSSFVLNQLKSTYHENRPYWEIPIDANKCETGFGNPSGHMLGNCFFWVTAYLHAYNEVGIIVPRMSVFCTAYIVKMALTAFGLVYIIMMGFSRMYLGAHTLNQVLYGSLWGFTLAIICHYKVKPFFLNMPERLLGDGDGTGQKY
jgi:membrane-associated phospholipid phosphatase